MVNCTTRILLVTLASGLLLTGCKTFGSASAKTQSGQELVDSAKASKTQLLAKKADAKTTQTPPKAVPKAITSGSATIAPPTLSDSAAFATWEFAGVDLNGNGEHEEGVALYDATTDTLCIWFEDDLDLKGEVATCQAFLWISDHSVGLIFDVADAEEEAIVAVAAADNGFSGWIICASDGTSEVLAIDESYLD